MHIRDLLVLHQPSSIFDIGCGEGKLLAFLANDISITKLAGIDLLKERLLEAKSTLEPRPLDFTVLRETTLSISLYHGSVLNCDSSILEGHKALICTEVYLLNVAIDFSIEHILPEHLDQFAKSIFSIHTAELIILTTPNADFNVLFPSLGYKTADQKFRDADHKFEWTRQEFQEWCNRKAKQFGFHVLFGGVGVLSDKIYDDSIGFCTQSASFTRTLPPLSTPASSRCSEPLVRIEYPFFDASGITADDVAAYILGTVIPSRFMDYENTISVTKESLWSLYTIRQRCQGQKSVLDATLETMIESKQTVETNGAFTFQKQKGVQIRKGVR